MATLTFNKLHKNGWLSYKTAGVAGAVFVDRRMVAAGVTDNPPATIVVEGIDLLPAGAGATEAQAAKAAKKLANEAAKAAKAEAAAAKAAARLEKLQASAAKAEAAAAKAREKAGVTA